MSWVVRLPWARTNMGNRVDQVSVGIRVRLGRGSEVASKVLQTASNMPSTLLRWFTGKEVKLRTPRWLHLLKASTRNVAGNFDSEARAVGSACPSPPRESVWTNCV